MSRKYSGGLTLPKNLIQNYSRINITTGRCSLRVAHVAYIAKGKVIGLSKINRIVQYIAARPQVQERMTVQILKELKESLQTEDVAVVIDAHHHCVSSRGIRDIQSSTTTSEFSGKFKDDDKCRTEFFTYIAK